MKRPATKVEFEKAGDKDKKEATLTSEKVVEPKSVAHPVIFKRPASKQVPGPKPTKRNVEEKVEVRKKPAAQKETFGLKTSTMTPASFSAKVAWEVSKKVVKRKHR